jgi:hypothetical protein
MRGDQPVRLVHTIVYDGDQNKDFIRGLGVVFDVPMREQIGRIGTSGLPTATAASGRSRCN